MIIQVRGTSGSGKTTAMRKVMEEYPKLSRNDLDAVYTDGRRNPLYYSDGGSLSVLGSYESTCGGCDTIHGYDLLISLARERYDVGHVLMEGLLLSEDSRQTLSLLPREIRVIFLQTPLDVCLERVRGRREARGNDKPLNVNNTSKRVATINRARVKLEAAGILCRSASCDQAPRLILQWLKEAR